jgi:ParB-like chromosome segregation protein Spo0J
MSTLEFHPLANLFPLIEGVEFDELVADIKANGLSEPIVVFDDKILDGRNRYRACVAAGVQHRVMPYRGAPLAFVISKNLHRRHLDESQRAIVAARIATLKQGARTDLASIEAMSQADAAELLNVSRSGVQRAREVLDHGAPELQRAVERGAVSVSAAADVATLRQQEQTEIVARGEREILEAAKAIRAQKAEERYAARIVRIAQTSAGNTALPSGR